MRSLHLYLLVLTLASPASFSEDLIDHLGELQPISLAAVHYPPYHDPNLPNEGILAEVAKEAFLRSGYQLSIIFQPWARVVAATKVGSFDGIIGVWLRKHRTDWCEFSEPLGTNDIQLFKRKDFDFTFNHYKDLKSFTVGIVRGYANPPAFDEAGLITEVGNTDAVNLNKLINRRIEFSLHERALVQYVLTTQFPQFKGQIESVGPSLKIEQSYMCITKAFQPDRRSLLLNDFNSGLRRIKSDGTYSAIMKKYGLLD